MKLTLFFVLFLSACGGVEKETPIDANTDAGCVDVRNVFVPCADGGVE